MVDNKLDKLWLEEKCRMLFDYGLISYLKIWGVSAI